MTDLTLLYEHGPVLVVGKPGGLLTQAVPGIDSLEVRLRALLQQREQRTGNFYLAILHRLDRPVSGAVMAARNVRAARRISRQFEQREVEKTYLALVEGAVQPVEGTWTDHMRKVPDQARAEIVAPDHPEARQAILHYRVRQSLADRTLLEIRLETGRMHQIRVQFASRGHPVCGDEQYGSRLAFGPEVQDPRARWIALHAWQIVFEHPMTHQRIEVTAPLSEEIWSGPAGQARRWAEELGPQNSCGG